MRARSGFLLLLHPSICGDSFLGVGLNRPFKSTYLIFDLSFENWVSAGFLSREASWLAGVYRLGHSAAVGLIMECLCHLLLLLLCLSWGHPAEGERGHSATSSAVLYITPPLFYAQHMN